MLKIMLLIGATLLFHSCTQINKEVGLKDDNPIEQAVEGLIKDETGLDVDLSPETPEKK